MFKPTREQRNETRDMLSQYFDVDTGRYNGGMSDQNIANAVNVPLYYVAQFREDFFGELTTDTVDAKAVADLRLEVAEIAAKVTKLETMIEALQLASNNGSTVSNELPKLRHTKVTSAELCGTQLEKKQCSWHGVLEAIVLVAISVKKDKTLRLLEGSKVNFKEYEENNDGYKFFEDGGISIQRMEAARTWKAVDNIAKEFHLKIVVDFVWENKEGAERPNCKGRIESR